jgi:rhodanese-related sulfurtransferase
MQGEPTMEKTLDIRQWLAAAFVVLAVLAMAAMDRPAARPSLNVPEVSVEAAEAMRAAGALVIDVRAGVGAHIPGALLIPLENLAARLAEIEHAKAQPVLVYCGNGTTRGQEAVQLLMRAGFANVVNLAPGFGGWQQAGKPVVGA